MAAKLNSVVMYEVCDALACVIKYDAKTGQMWGDTSQVVHFGNVKVEFELKLTSHLITSDEYMFMFRSMGNLALFVCVSKSPKVKVLKIHLLNLAKMDSVEKWLEKANPLDESKALALLGKAVVKSFQKQNKTWFEAPAAA